MSRPFRRWQLRVGVPDQVLATPVAEMRAGLIDAELGGGVVQQLVTASREGRLHEIDSAPANPH